MPNQTAKKKRETLHELRYLERKFSFLENIYLSNDYSFILKLIQLSTTSVVITIAQSQESRYVSKYK